MVRSLGLLRVFPWKLSTIVLKLGLSEEVFSIDANLLSPCWHKIIFPSLSIFNPLAPSIPFPMFGAYPVFPLGLIKSDTPLSSFHFKTLF